MYNERNETPASESVLSPGTQERAVHSLFKGISNEFLCVCVCVCHQEFKAFRLCFAVLVVATSAASVCKCEDKKVRFKV